MNLADRGTALIRTSLPRGSPIPGSLSKSLCWCLGALLLSAGAARADVIVVDGGTRAAIQDALNRASDGDTVLILPGQYLIEATETLLIPTDGVTLQGSGTDQTVLYRDIDTTNTVMLRARNRQRVRVTGIAFQGVTSPDSAGTEVGVQMDSTVDFRVDNCFFHPHRTLGRLDERCQLGSRGSL